MAEITIGDLLTWEPRLSLVHDDFVDHADQRDLDEDREVTWVVTVRASLPVLPPLRGGELVIVPERTIEDSGIPLQELLREVASRGATGIIFDHPLDAPDGLVRLRADPIPVDLESDVNRLLTEQRGAIYRSGTELGRVLQHANSLGVDVEQVLESASDYLEMDVAVVGPNAELIASSTPRNGAMPKLRAVNGPHMWNGEYYGTRLAGAETLWLGPVPDDRRALTRLVADRLAVAVEAALAHAIDVRPRGNARSIALAGLLSAAAVDAARGAAALGLPANGLYRVALGSDPADRLAIQRDLAVSGAVHDAADFDRYAATLIEVRGRGKPPESERKPRIAPNGSRPAAPRGHWVAISGPVTGAAHIPEAARQARFVAALIEHGLVEGETLRFDRVSDIGVYRLLYPLWGSAELDAFAADALGTLLTADRRGTLRTTLLAYLEAGGSQVEAAARLGVHRNTLSYRLKQIGALTGSEPIDPESHLALHMALLASMLPPAP
ncbi:MAG TPA: helix-turn-helix domain-containing protein [Thermomicrobiales bacterium]|nr:helix-turn-helix domain-containing protein [Thermomicrobiales bacterium]